MIVDGEKMDIFSRTRLLIGAEGINKLRESKVAVFGVGGVGSYAVEALARAGIGHLYLFDPDEVEITNINRQLGALHSTIGRSKVQVLKERAWDINPQAEVLASRVAVTPQNADNLVREDYSYIIDALDSVRDKIALIERSVALGVPLVSSMGAGNRLDPTKLELADISETKGCPLARVIRQKLRKKGIANGVPVVYSPETPFRLCKAPKERGGPLGSISFVPAVAGLLLVSKAVTDLLAES